MAGDLILVVIDVRLDGSAVRLVEIVGPARTTVRAGRRPGRIARAEHGVAVTESGTLEETCCQLGGMFWLRWKTLSGSSRP